jgi:hypothetical protein
MRIGEFLDILAAADPAGFTELITDLASRAETVDPACRRALEPVYAANAEALQPLASLLQATWQLAQTPRPGGSNA